MRTGKKWRDIGGLIGSLTKDAHPALPPEVNRGPFAQEERARIRRYLGHPSPEPSITSGNPPQG